MNTVWVLFVGQLFEVDCGGAICQPLPVTSLWARGKKSPHLRPRVFYPSTTAFRGSSVSFFFYHIISVGSVVASHNTRGPGAVMKLTSNDSASNSDCASVQWSESGFWGSLAAPCFCVTVHGLKKETRVFSRFVSWSWQFAFRDCYSTRPWITINEFPLHPRGNISPSLPSCIQLSLSSHTPACGRGSVRTAVPTESQEDPSSKWSGAFFLERLQLL